MRALTPEYIYIKYFVRLNIARLYLGFDSYFGNKKILPLSYIRLFRIPGSWDTIFVCIIDHRSYGTLSLTLSASQAFFWCHGTCGYVQILRGGIYWWPFGVMSSKNAAENHGPWSVNFFVSGSPRGSSVSQKLIHGNAATPMYKTNPSGTRRFRLDAINLTVSALL